VRSSGHARAILVAIAIAAAAPSIGCKKIRERVFAKETAVQTGGEIDAGEDPFAIDDPASGAMLAGLAQIPADFPADLPIYPGAKPVVATTTREDGGDDAKYTVVAQTGDSPEQVMSFYRGKFPKPALASSTGGVQVMRVTTPSGVNASITAIGAGAQTLVTLSAGKGDASPRGFRRDAGG